MHPLDNVIWQALTTRQAHFAEGSGAGRRFIPDVSPLAAIEEVGPAGYRELAALLDPDDTLGIFLDDPYSPVSGWSYVVGAPLLQMICDNGKANGKHPSEPPALLELGDKDSPEMIALTALTKPGPFGPRTHEFGKYLGIRADGELVAMAGERLKVDGHTEVSAVCTHPNHIGKGYAAILMKAVMHGIRERGEIPFLHVRENNTRAIEIYKRLGFRVRKSGHFAVLRKA
ncbi:MAG TPA: GNAT family N-acetyltransferase [Candidatus Solibacter sp.]|nr:GNAT family N-acetyltransferase [Candidatus Solibacter sp.]